MWAHASYKLFISADDFLVLRLCFSFPIKYYIQSLINEKKAADLKKLKNAINVLDYFFSILKITVITTFIGVPTII